MTIDVVTQPEFSPPRVRVDVASPAGTIMQSVSVYRETAGGRELLRQQPEAGFDSRSVYDYEMPREIPLTYSWSAEYVDPTLFTELFSEPWASVAAWSGDTVIASVAAGEVSLNAFSGGQRIYHTETLDWSEITVDGLTTPAGGAGVGIPVLWFTMGSSYLALGTSGGTLRGDAISGGVLEPFTTSIDASQPFTITRTSTGMLIRGTGGEKSLHSDGVALTEISIEGDTDGPVVVGALTVSSAGAPTTIEETAAPVTITVSDAWLIHPASPALSVPIGFDDMQRVSIESIGDVTQRSNTTLHSALGESRLIPVTSGPREADSLRIALVAETAEYETALRAIIADETPILIRTPPSWDVGFHDGFYSIGDVKIGRLVQLYGHHQRTFELPLFSVASPTVTQQNAGWSWAALAAEFPTWADVYSAYETWADVLIDNRKPGY